MFKRLKNVVSVIVSLVRFIIIKLLRPHGFVFYPIERFSPDTMVNIWKNGRLILGKRVRAHTGTKLSVTNGAVLEVGDDTSFNYNCIVVARKHVRIGQGVEFGPNVLIYDHDHDFRAPGGLKAGVFKSGDIEIGDGSWIGANSVILRGSKIGKNCVIGAGSVIHGTVPDNTLAIQKRTTELREIIRS
jgi:acetyltransferase-like isoleucine patch superfamily enzyme